MAIQVSVLCFGTLRCHGFLVAISLTTWTALNATPPVGECETLLPYRACLRERRARVQQRGMRKRKMRPRLYFCCKVVHDFWTVLTTYIWHKRGGTWGCTDVGLALVIAALSGVLLEDGDGDPATALAHVDAVVVADLEEVLSREAGCAVGDDAIALHLAETQAAVARALDKGNGKGKGQGSSEEGMRREGGRESRPSGE